MASGSETVFHELGLWAAHGLYEEYGGAPAAGVVTGVGTIHGREAVIVSNDAVLHTLFGSHITLDTQPILIAKESYSLI